MVEALKFEELQDILSDILLRLQEEEIDGLSVCIAIVGMFAVIVEDDSNSLTKEHIITAFESYPFKDNTERHKITPPILFNENIDKAHKAITHVLIERDIDIVNGLSLMVLLLAWMYELAVDDERELIREILYESL